MDYDSIALTDWAKAPECRIIKRISRIAPPIVAWLSSARWCEPEPGAHASQVRGRFNGLNRALLVLGGGYWQYLGVGGGQVSCHTRHPNSLWSEDALTPRIWRVGVLCRAHTRWFQSRSGVFWMTWGVVLLTTLGKRDGKVKTRGGWVTGVVLNTTVAVASKWRKKVGGFLVSCRTRQ